MQAIKQLQCERPYFLTPVCEKHRLKRMEVSNVSIYAPTMCIITARMNTVLLMSQFSAVDKIEEAEERVPWTLETSIFWKRKKENESCSVFDSDQVSVNSCLQVAGPLAPRALPGTRAL